MFEGKAGFAGELGLSVIRGGKAYEVDPDVGSKVRKAPLAWRIRNFLMPKHLKFWAGYHLFRPLANMFGVMTAMGYLELKHINGLTGEVTDYGVVSYGVITTAGVTFLRDDWNANGQDFTTMNYHGLGTGAGAEAVGDTALTTESTTALNPNSVRATGTQSVQSTPSFRSVGVLTFDADAAIIEHGLFSSATVAAGTLWDRSIFSAINVVGANGDSIQSTYTCTLSAGG